MGRYKVTYALLQFLRFQGHQYVGGKKTKLKPTVQVFQAIFYKDDVFGLHAIITF